MGDVFHHTQECAMDRCPPKNHRGLSADSLQPIHDLLSCHLVWIRLEEGKRDFLTTMAGIW